MKRAAGRGDVELRAMIQACGLRCTAPRLGVLRKLVVARTPLSHGEIVEALRAEGFDRATVYRNLVDLADAGLLTRTDLGDHTWRFELRREEHAAEHPHFVCTDCGTVSCLPGVSVRIARPRAAPAVVARVTTVLLKGTCTQCG